MASIENVSLTVTPAQEGLASVHVQYQIAGSALDIAAQRSYAERCELVSVDVGVPETDAEPVLHTVHSAIVQFPNHETGEPHWTRSLEVVVPTATLRTGQITERLENHIRARVKLVRAPTLHSYSNTVRLGGGQSPLTPVG